MSNFSRRLIEDSQPDRYDKELLKYYKNLIKKYKSTVVKLHKAKPGSEEHRKLKNELDKNARFIDNAERKYADTLGNVDFASDFDEKSFVDKTRRRKKQIVLGATVLSIALIAASYKVYKNFSDKCRRYKYHKEEYKSCKIRAVDEAIRKLKTDLDKCKNTNNPVKCRSKVEERIKKYEIEKKELQNNAK